MKVIHTVPHLITPINDVIFTALNRSEGGSISEEISQEQADIFLQIPTFELYVDPTAQKEPAPLKPAQETKEQRKARLAAEEKAAADKAAAEKAEADRLAAEKAEADRLAAEAAAQQTAPDEKPAEGSENKDSDEVF